MQAGKYWDGASPAVGDLTVPATALAQEIRSPESPVTCSALTRR